MLGRITIAKVFYFVMFMVMASFLFGGIVKIVIVAYLCWLLYKGYTKVKGWMHAE